MPRSGQPITEKSDEILEKFEKDRHIYIYIYIYIYVFFLRGKRECRVDSPSIFRCAFHLDQETFRTGLSYASYLKVVPSLIKYRNDINEIEYIDSYRSKSGSKNFFKARVRMRKVISILVITYLTRSLMGNRTSSTVILKL